MFELSKRCMISRLYTLHLLTIHRVLLHLRVFYLFKENIMNFNDLTAFRLPNLTVPPNPIISAINSNLASEFYNRLISWINDFHKGLDEEHEAGMRLVNFGQSITFHIEDIGFSNPSLISFTGRTETGEPVELIQHVTQISILLMKMERAKPEEPKRPIGFASWEDFEKQKSS